MPRMLKLAAYLLKVSRGMPLARLSMAAMAVLGLASGFAMAALVGVINELVNRQGPPPRELVWSFVGLLVLRPVLRFTSQALNLRLNEYSFFAIRMDLFRSILATPIRHLEQMGGARLMAGLSTDVGQVSGGVVAMPGLAMNLSMVIGYTVYLGWLALPLLPVLLGVTVVGWVTFGWAMRRAVAQIAAGRELYDKLFQRVRTLTEGTKELKMHSRRREVFLAELEEISRAHRRQMRKSDVTLTGLGTWSETLFFIAIGVLLLVTHRFYPVDTAVLSSFVLTVLLLRGPIDSLNSALPVLTQATVAMKKLDQLTDGLSALTGDTAPHRPTRPGAEWRHLELRAVTHSYRRESDDERFVLGPVDLSLRPGELVFIVGGNGSGKTTLAKILLGIYAPESGEILLDGEPVGDADRDRYRQHFSVVFADFFLFDALLGLESPGLDERAARYLDELHLQHKVRVSDGQLSTTELSQGQRKRLALLVAYLEDRPIYLFDEWAADQDPHFKEVFYRRILPDLRDRGKTVLVISHDDRYYGVADRIIRLEDGSIRFDGSAAGYLAPPTVEVPRVLHATPTLTTEAGHV